MIDMFERACEFAGGMNHDRNLNGNINAADYTTAGFGSRDKFDELLKDSGLNPLNI